MAPKEKEEVKNDKDVIKDIRDHSLSLIVSNTLSESMDSYHKVEFSWNSSPRRCVGSGMMDSRGVAELFSKRSFSK